MDKRFKDRIDYSGNIEDVSLHVCKDFNLGIFKENEIIKSGYEDFNMKLVTDKGAFLVKIFSISRTLEECKRYVDVMNEAFKAGVRIPKLHKYKQGYICTIDINGSELRIVVMDFIEGENLYNLNYSLNEEEIKFIANESAKINSMNLKPEFIYDSWAAVNFEKEFEKKQSGLSNSDIELLKPILEEFKKVNIEELPHCFVHGDIIKTNTIRDKKGGLWIVDFGVSNYYPRILEVAAIASNLLFDSKNRIKTDNNLKIFLKEYQKKIKLTPEELNVLPIFIRTNFAIHILSASYEKNVRENNTPENEKWVTDGKIALKQTMNNTTLKITYFVHGTTIDNEEEISSGWKDVEISKLGVKQSVDLWNRIKNEKFDVVFCSDLKRAVKSAELTFKDKVMIIKDKRLRECNYGDYNGKSSDIVEPLQEENIIKRFPNGESYEDVKKRMNDFINFLKSNYNGKHIAIVAHKAPQLSLEVLINGKTWEEAFAEDWRKRKAWQPGWEYVIK